MKKEEIAAMIGQFTGRMFEDITGSEKEFITLFYEPTDTSLYQVITNINPDNLSNIANLLRQVADMLEGKKETVKKPHLAKPNFIGNA